MFMKMLGIRAKWDMEGYNLQDAWASCLLEYHQEDFDKGTLELGTREVSQ